jgi:hypothetical protein
MDFLDLMDTLLALRAKFPGMEWHVSSFPGSSEPTVTVRLPVSEENASLLRDGQAMFAPVEGGA